MRKACDNEVASRRPSSKRRIIKLRAREIEVDVKTAGDKHLSVGEQRRGVLPPRLGETTGRGPSSARRAVKFCTGQIIILVVTPPCDEYLAVLQQRCGGKIARVS